MNQLRHAIAASVDVDSLAASLSTIPAVSIAALSAEPVSVAASAADHVADYRELLLGGERTVKVLGRKNLRQFVNVEHVKHLDWDLRLLPWGDDWFDEIHCYHQLQRLGQQGDWRLLFAQFSELWRVLKPNGVLCLSLPSPFSDWIWGDPGHTRAITMQTITYLQQPEYDKQLLTTAMVDYRSVYKADFEPEFLQDDGRELRTILRAVKPSRCSV
jgi:SAM-dependent methyltransferase